MSLAAFSSQSRALKSGTPAPVATASPASQDEVESARECPAGVETLGRGTWTLLHTMAATCWFCAKDLQGFIAREGVRASSRDELGNWLCRAHNEVNNKLGKPNFDCARWEERWRTGWKDGSCD